MPNFQLFLAIWFCLLNLTVCFYVASYVVPLLVTAMVMHSYVNMFAGIHHIAA